MERGRRKVLEKFARMKRGENVYGRKRGKKGRFGIQLKKGLKRFMAKVRRGMSYRKLEKSKLSPEEKFRMILEASRNS